MKTILNQESFASRSEPTRTSSQDTVNNKQEDTDSAPAYFDVQSTVIFRTLIIKFIALQLIPLFFYFHTQNLFYTSVAEGIVLFFGGLKFIIGIAKLRVYPSFVEFTEGQSGRYRYHISLYRIYKVIPKHNIFQPKNVGDIEIKVGKLVKEKRSIASMMIGVRTPKTEDNYLSGGILKVRNVANYMENINAIIKAIEADDEKRRASVEGTATLQGISNVDELLPWSTNSSNTNKNT